MVMICNNCGKEYEGNFCPNCGTPAGNTGSVTDKKDVPQTTLNRYNDSYYASNYQSVNNQPQKAKKPLYKKWWFWLIVVIAFLVFVSGLGSCGDTDDADNSYATTEKSTTTETTTEKVTTTTKPTTTVPKLSESEYKAQCGTISFSTLSRNPDKYKGKKYKITGKVIQVSESTFLGNTYCDLRIDMTEDEYGFWDDTIYATVTIKEGEDRILEDDIITIWGVCEGNYTYTSVMGASISLPSIDIEYFTIN